MKEKPVLVHPLAFDDINFDDAVKTVSSFCHTQGGKQFVRQILTSPIYCKRTLLQRARQIQGFRRNSRAIADELDSCKDDEEGAAWCADEVSEKDEDTVALLEAPYFSSMVTRPFNKLWPALWANNAYAIFAAPAMALVAPISYFLAPYLMIRFKLKIPLDFKTFVQLMYHSFKGAGAALNIAFGKAPSFAMQLFSVLCTCFVYFQNVVATFRHSLSLVATCKKITMKMNCLSRMIKISDSVTSGKDESFFSLWTVVPPSKANEGPNPPVRDEKIVPWATGFSGALRDFRSLDREWARNKLKRLFFVDALSAITAATKFAGMKPVNYLPDGTDALLIVQGKRMRREDVANDIAMIKGKNGIVLTGQNASGKSTVLRMTGCVVTLAQTIGWTTAAACAIQPVKHFTTMMGIRDDPDAGRSRFQNELLRAGECVEAARNRPDDLGLLLMDEIFGGTDPSQGDACGGKILTSLTETPGCMYILATHQKGLVEHSKSLDGVMRFKMLPEKYVMTEGVNDHHNASRLFEESPL